MSRPNYVPTLDGWRAVAILMVLGEHALPLVVDLGFSPTGTFARLLRRGSLGVDIFFTLSGYLIGTLLMREKARTGRIAVGGFFVRRAFRIIPALWTYLGIVALLAAVNILISVTTPELIATFCFLRNYIIGTWYTGHTWSLALEVHFYILAPLLVAALSRNRAFAATLTLSLLVVAGRAIEARTGVIQALLPGTLATFRTENRLDGLLNGLLLALILDHAVARAQLTRLLSTAGTTALLVIGAVGLSYLGRDGLVRVGLVVPVAVAHTILRPAALAGRILELAPLRWLGLISYSLYLWQQLFLPDREEMMPGTMGLLQQSAWSLPLAFLLALASYRLVELPLTRLGRRRAGPEPLASLDQRAEGSGAKQTPRPSP